MHKIVLTLFLVFQFVGFAQKSDFKNLDFTRANNIANLTKSKNLYELNKLTNTLTKELKTDAEKVRAIYKWICLNVANDFKLYSKNERKRKKYRKDSVKLEEWNSELKRELFKKLLKRKKTICSGYAYLFKAMCDVINIESKIIYGFGRTADITYFDFDFPNHAWNAVKINDKWYLCDATWAAGTSLTDENRFIFKYNDGYFLTEPELFIQNHFPLEKKFSLLDEKTPSFEEFVNLPLFYGDAYKYFSKNISPKKMYHKVKKDSILTSKIKLKENIDISKLKFIITNGVLEKELKPKVKINDDNILLNYKFEKIGYFDVHLYLKDEILVTYIYEVVKND